MKKLILICLALNGCASIINGTRQSVGISSNPSGATAKDDEGNVCITPCSFNLKRRRDHNIVIEKQGYEPAGQAVVSSASGWLWGNLVFGGVIGLGVDFAAGGAWKLRPEVVSVELKKQER